MLCAAALIAAAQTPSATLTGFAFLPADTFADGPPSGAWRGARAGRPEFSSQPVQGISALWPAGDDEWWALSDNGFGTHLNSADYLLRIYRLAVEWGSGREAGAVHVRGTVTLSDPDRHMPAPIVRETTPERLLTGGDLDPESFVRMPDGSFWIGDEFGPFLLHVDGQGRLLAPPYEAPGLRSPDHPQLAPADAGQASVATVRRSRGFEGLARYGAHLYAVIEAGVGADADAAVVHEFDLAARAFTGTRWRLPLTSAAHALTDFVSLGTVHPACGARFLAIERDGGHGSEARLKRVLEVQIAGSALTTRVVADLLAIDNPRRLAGHAARFSFPFITTEALWPVALDTLVLANDNNFPAGEGRPGYLHDPTEFIRLRLAAALCR